MNGGGEYKSAEEAEQGSMDVEDTEWSGPESNQWKDSQPDTWKVNLGRKKSQTNESVSINSKLRLLFLTNSSFHNTYLVSKKFII